MGPKPDKFAGQADGTVTTCKRLSVLQEIITPVTGAILRISPRGASSLSRVACFLTSLRSGLQWFPAKMYDLVQYRTLYVTAGSPDLWAKINGPSIRRRVSTVRISAYPFVRPLKLISAPERNGPATIAKRLHASRDWVALVAPSYTLTITDFVTYLCNGLPVLVEARDTCVLEADGQSAWIRETGWRAFDIFVQVAILPPESLSSASRAYRRKQYERLSERVSA